MHPTFSLVVFFFLEPLTCESFRSWQCLEWSLPSTVLAANRPSQSLSSTIVAAAAAAAAATAAASQKQQKKKYRLYTRLRQLVALGHTDELQAELEKFKQQPTDLRSHLEKVCSTTQGCWYADIIKVSMQYAPYLA